MTPQEFRVIRDGLGASRKQIADRLRVTPQAVNYWEAGQRAIAPMTAEMMGLLRDGVIGL